MRRGKKDPIFRTGLDSPWPRFSVAQDLPHTVFCQVLQSPAKSVHIFVHTQIAISVMGWVEVGHHPGGDPQAPEDCGAEGQREVPSSLQAALPLLPQPLVSPPWLPSLRTTKPSGVSQRTFLEILLSAGSGSTQQCHEPFWEDSRTTALTYDTQWDGGRRRIYAK